MAAAYGEDRALLDEAKRNLEHKFVTFQVLPLSRFSCVCLRVRNITICHQVFEALQDSAELLAHTLCFDPDIFETATQGLAHPASPKSVLRTNPVPELSDIVQRRSPLDVELYEYAWALHKTRLERMRKLQARLAYMSEANMYMTSHTYARQFRLKVVRTGCQSVKLGSRCWISPEVAQCIAIAGAASRPQ